MDEPFLVGSSHLQYPGDQDGALARLPVGSLTFCLGLLQRPSCVGQTLLELDEAAVKSRWTWFVESGDIGAELNQILCSALDS